MSFISLPTGKLQEKTETKKFKNLLAGYLGRFYRNLADNVDSSLGSDFYGRIANNANLQTMSKNISQQPVIFLKECKMLLIIT